MNIILILFKNRYILIIKVFKSNNSETNIKEIPNG